MRCTLCRKRDATLIATYWDEHETAQQAAICPVCQKRVCFAFGETLIRPMSQTRDTDEMPSVPVPKPNLEKAR